MLERLAKGFDILGFKACRLSNIIHAWQMQKHNMCKSLPWKVVSILTNIDFKCRDISNFILERKRS